MRALVNFCSEKVQFIVVNEISFDVNAKFRRSTYICIRMAVGTRAQMRLTFSSRNRTIDSRVCTIAFFANLSILNSIYRLNGLIGQFLFWLMLHWLKCHYESVIIANIMSHHSWNVTIISVCSVLQQKFAISRQSGFCKLSVSSTSTLFPMFSQVQNTCRRSIADQLFLTCIQSLFCIIIQMLTPFWVTATRYYTIHRRLSSINLATWIDFF